jgi:hypothetical protein
MDGDWDTSQKMLMVDEQLLNDFCWEAQKAGLKLIKSFTKDVQLGPRSRLTGK